MRAKRASAAAAAQATLSTVGAMAQTAKGPVDSVQGRGRDEIQGYRQAEGMYGDIREFLCIIQ